MKSQSRARYTRGLVKDIGGVERAAAAAGVSVSSISNYQIHGNTPDQVLRALEAKADDIEALCIWKASEIFHRETADVLQAAFSGMGAAAAQKEIGEADWGLRVITRSIIARNGVVQ